MMIIIESRQLNIILFFIVLPLWVSLPQRPNNNFLSRHFNAKHFDSQSLISKKSLSIEFINEFIYSKNKSNSQKSSSILLIDSLVNICQPPYNNQKLTFDHDNLQRIKLYKEYFWYLSQWDISDRNNYYYDSLGNLTSELNEWYGGQWFPDYKTTYIYDEFRNKTSELEEDYIDTGWVNKIKTINTYDKFGSLEKKTWMNWDGTDWINEGMVTYYYASGITDSMFFENWIGGRWESNLSLKLQYDNQGNMVKSFWKSWNDSQWVNYLMGSYNHDLKGNIVLGTIEDWVGNQWVNSSRYFYTYNSNNYFTNGTTEIWQNDNWISGDGEMDFNGLDRAFIGTNLSVYYKDISEVKKNIAMDGFSLSQNYPNPFNPTTTISYSIPKDGMVYIKVYDILGNAIASLVNDYQHKGYYEINFNAGKLPSAIYIYRIQSGAFNKSKMMVLQK